MSPELKQDIKDMAVALPGAALLVGYLFVFLPTGPFNPFGFVAWLILLIMAFASWIFAAFITEINGGRSWLLSTAFPWFFDRIEELKNRFKKVDKTDHE